MRGLETHTISSATLEKCLKYEVLGNQQLDLTITTVTQALSWEKEERIGKVMLNKSYIKAIFQTMDSEKDAGWKRLAESHLFKPQL